MFDYITLIGEAMCGVAGFLSAHYLWPSVKVVEKLAVQATPKEAECAQQPLCAEQPFDHNNITLDSVNYGRLQFVLTRYVAEQTAAKDVGHYTTINKDSLQVGDIKFVKMDDTLSRAR